ncbi:MAG TPA: hypothetical protein VFF43_09655 [Caldimonas sp.]|nr:hypothetical protein [Caldimonas sp.]
MLTPDDLDAIEQRAELTYRYGDTTALRAEDVAALIAECRALQTDNRRLVALVHQSRDRALATQIRRR